MLTNSEKWNARIYGVMVALLFGLALFGDALADWLIPIGGL